MQQLDPDSARLQATLREGYTRLAQGDHRGAADCCRRVLQRQPELPEGHFLVGLVASDSGDMKTAIQAFGSVTRLQAQHGAAWAQLARLFMRMGHINRADEALARAVQNADGNPMVEDAIATVYTQLGDAPEAARWLESAVGKQPRNIGFLLNRANNQMFLGDFDAARASIESALSVNPDNANAHWLLSGLERANDRSHVAVLENLLKAPERAAKDEAYLAYGLGKELEDLQDWPAAFAAFGRGATARRRTLSYDENAEKELFATLSGTLTPEWLAAQSPGFQTTAPIFIVGQPRTGTTLVERIITSHSRVYSAGELRQFDGALRRLLNFQGTKPQSAELVSGAAALDMARVGETYMKLSKPLRGDLPHFVDKLPANYRYLPLILAALPRAKIVHVRRNPMDSCFASFKQLFADAYPHSYEQTEMARHHGRYYRLMADWRERFGDRFHEIDYEAVAANPEPHARALIEFLEIPWEDACLEFYRQSGAVTTASVVQVREAAHTRSVGRWRRYETELAPLREELESMGIPIS
ncbi:MAG: tetratricopeptide (TPR) repeat protein [Halieaceae bacterium]|jgi:tetratricopeptide (TPR) repeat protein